MSLLPHQTDGYRLINEVFESGKRRVWVRWEPDESWPRWGYSNDDGPAFPSGIHETRIVGTRKIVVDWTAEELAPTIEGYNFSAEEAFAKEVHGNWSHTFGDGSDKDDWRIGMEEGWCKVNE
jgi:hypothetical protein